jgi:hypothetical protein
VDATDPAKQHIDLLYDIIGEWGSNRFGYSYKRAHFTEKALNMAQAIGRPLEEVHGVFKKVVRTKMDEAIGTVEPVDLSHEELAEIYRKIILYLFSYGFPYGTEFPSAPNAMRTTVEPIAKLIEVPMDTLYPVWATIIRDSIEWSFEPIPDDIELPNDDDWRERKRGNA